MAEKRVLVIAKRINGDWLHITRENDQPFLFHLSGGMRDYTGQSHFINGQHEVSLQVFPGEQVAIEEKVQG